MRLLYFLFGAVSVVLVVLSTSDWSLPPSSSDRYLRGIVNLDRKLYFNFASSLRMVRSRIVCLMDGGLDNIFEVDFSGSEALLNVVCEILLSATSGIVWSMLCGSDSWNVDLSMGICSLSMEEMIGWIVDFSILITAL